MPQIHNRSFSALPGRDANWLRPLTGHVTPRGYAHARVLRHRPRDIVAAIAAAPAHDGSRGAVGRGRSGERRGSEQIFADGVEDGDVKVALPVEIKADAEEAAEEEEDDAEPNGRQLTTAELPLVVVVVIFPAAAAGGVSLAAAGGQRGAARKMVLMILFARRKQRDDVQVACGGGVGKRSGPAIGLRGRRMLPWRRLGREGVDHG